MEESLQIKLDQEMDLRGLKVKTKYDYQNSLNRFFKFNEKKTPEEICVQDIKDYQLYLLRERKLSPSTVNRSTCAIRFFYIRVLKRHTYRHQLPKMKENKIIPVLLSRNEVMNLIDSIHSVFYKAVIMFLYSTGMRQGEMRRVKVSDIDRELMVVNIRKAKGDKDRQAILSPLMLSVLETYWNLFRKNNPVKSDYLFVPVKNTYNGKICKKLSHRAAGYIIDSATKAAGIKKRVIPHSLRHSFAIHLLEKGVHMRHIQYLLGHDHIETTVKYTYIANIQQIPVKSPLDCLSKEVG